MSDHRGYARRIGVLAVAASVSCALAGCRGAKGPGVAALEALSIAEARAAATQGALPAEPSIVHLVDLVARASAVSPSVTAALARWRAAAMRASQAGSLPEPELMLDARFGDSTRADGLSGVEVRQALPWAGKRGLDARAALAEAEEARARYVAAGLASAQRARVAWWEYRHLSREIAATAESLDLMRAMESVARAMFAAGAGSAASAVKAQVELGRIENDLRAAEERRPVLSSEILAAAGLRAGDAPLPWPKEDGAAGVSLPAGDGLPEEERLLALVDERNPELTAMRADVAREEAMEALARKAGLPDAVVGLGYMPADYATEVSLGLTLPIRRAKYAAARQEAGARLAAARADLEAARLDLAAALRGAAFRRRDAARRIALHRDVLLPKAREALALSRQSFEAGKADFLEVVEAQRTLLALDLGLSRAQADEGVATGEIESLTGGGFGTKRATHGATENTEHTETGIRK